MAAFPACAAAMAVSGGTALRCLCDFLCLCGEFKHGCVALEHHSAVAVPSHSAAEHIYVQLQANASCTQQHIWACVHQGRNFVQASDFVNDEKGTQELCTQAARWLFGCPRSVFPRADQDSDHEASQEGEAPTEDQLKVRCYCTCS